MTVASAEDDVDVDAGLVGTGSLGDRVWEDLDGDGDQDAGEPGIDGATVSLVWAGLDDAFGTADDATSAPTPPTPTAGTCSRGCSRAGTAPP